MRREHWNKGTIITDAIASGEITLQEAKELAQLKARLVRLEKLSWAIAKGEKDPETTGGLTQQDVADILGVSQQAVGKSEHSALGKVKAHFKAEGLDRHLN